MLKDYRIQELTDKENLGVLLRTLLFASLLHSSVSTHYCVLEILPVKDFWPSHIR